jgi:hypothetical protein
VALSSRSSTPMCGAIWAPGEVATSPSVHLGFPVERIENRPAVGVFGSSIWPSTARRSPRSSTSPAAVTRSPSTTAGRRWPRWPSDSSSDSAEPAARMALPGSGHREAVAVRVGAGRAGLFDVTADVIQPGSRAARGGIGPGQDVEVVGLAGAGA